MEVTLRIVLSNLILFKSNVGHQGKLYKNLIFFRYISSYVDHRDICTLQMISMSCARVRLTQIKREGVSKDYLVNSMNRSILFLGDRTGFIFELKTYLN